MTVWKQWVYCSANITAWYISMWKDCEIWSSFIFTWMLSDCLSPQALSLGTSEHKIFLEEGHWAGLELKQCRSPFLRTVVTLSALSRQMMHTPFIHDSTLMGSVTFPFSLAGCTWWEYEMPWRAVGRSSGWVAWLEPFTPPPLAPLTRPVRPRRKRERKGDSSNRDGV